MEEKDVTQTTDTGEMSFAEAFEESLVTLHTGDVVKGTIIGITPTEVYVNLGFKADGVIPITELTDDPLLKPDDIVKMGDEIDVFVARVNDMEGTVLLSKKKLDSIHGWQAIEDAFENKTILSGRIIEVIKGGVIVLCEGTKVFVPASQANDRYLNDLSVLENKQVSLRIIDINKRRRKIVGSIKSVLVEERARKMKEFWESVEKGKEYVGVVKTITPFGAFVDLGGVDGLIHISELSWNRIGHPSEVIKEGDEASVYIIEADREKNKVSLGYKRAEDNPWIKAKEQLHENDIVKCKVVRLVHFGAFVEILPDIDGLVHVSQIANHHIAKPSDELSVGQEVTAKIIEIDWENHKIGLSIRELLPDEPVQKPSNSEDAEPTSHVEEMKSTMGEVMEAIQLDNTVEEPAADE